MPPAARVPGPRQLRASGFTDGDVVQSYGREIGEQSKEEYDRGGYRDEASRSVLGRPQ